MKISQSDWRQRCIEALNHEEWVLRTVALDYWQHETHVPPEVTEAALDAIERHGWDEAFEFTHMVCNLPHTPRSLEWVHETLAAVRDDAGRADRSLPHVASWFSKAPVEWLTTHVGDFLESKEGTGISRGGLQSAKVGDPLTEAWNRTRFATLSSADLMTLVENTAKLAGEEIFATAEEDTLTLAGWELARRGGIADAIMTSWLDRALADPDDDAVGYLAGTTLTVIAKGGGRVPADLLLRILELDWEWTTELVSDALRVTANERDVAEVMEAYARGNWVLRLYVVDVIEACRFPALEPRLIELIEAGEPEDEDPAPLFGLGRAAVWYGSEASLAAARRLADEFPDKGDARDLHNALWLHDVLTEGLTPPLRQRLEVETRRRRQLKDRMAELDEGLLADDDEEEFFDEDIDWPVEVPLTPITAEPKVGRNDPCPCGSGKKYKKCCG